MPTLQPDKTAPNIGPERNGGNPKPSHNRAVPPLEGAWWKWTCGILMAYVIYGAFFIANGAAGFGKSGDVARIVFFHVPSAILSSVCYIVGTVYAVNYLWKSPMTQIDPWKRRMPEIDIRSAIAMELGFVFCILATVTGSIFAGAQWGSYWNWDPREISIVIMLLLYASYLVLRGAIPDDWEKRARLCAVYAVVALIPAQFPIWVVPRIPAVASLHPTNVLVQPSGTSLSYKAVLYPSFIAFTMLYIWLTQLRLRVWQLTQSKLARKAQG